MISEKTGIYGVIGTSVQKSLSPLIHNAAFEYHSIKAVYLPLVVGASNANSIISALSTLSFQGANVTVPYKTLILSQLQLIDPYAKKIGAVNTLVQTDQGWKGYSTDGYGFIAGLAELNIDLMKRSVLVIGAGGAARSIIHALAESGVKALAIKNRSKDSANEIVAELDLAEHYQDQKFDLLVNATSVGMDGIGLSAPLELINKAEIVVDLIYNPAMTPLLKLAKAQGKIIQNGLPMLLYQAMKSFEIWTSKTTPIEVLRQALRDKEGK